MSNEHALQQPAATPKEGVRRLVSFVLRAGFSPSLGIGYVEIVEIQTSFVIRLLCSRELYVCDEIGA